MNVSKIRLKELIEEELEALTALEESVGWWHDPRKIADMVLGALVDNGLNEEFATDFLQHLPISAATDFLKESKGKWWDFDEHRDEEETEDEY